MMRCLPVRYSVHLTSFLFFFFFNDTATTEIYTLSLHDALPISTRSPLQPLRTRSACRQRRSARAWPRFVPRSEEHTSELQSQSNLVCRLLLEKKKKKKRYPILSLANNYGCDICSHGP